MLQKASAKSCSGVLTFQVTSLAKQIAVFHIAPPSFDRAIEDSRQRPELRCLDPSSPSCSCSPRSWNKASSPRGQCSEKQLLSLTTSPAALHKIASSCPSDNAYKQHSDSAVPPFLITIAEISLNDSRRMGREGDRPSETLLQTYLAALRISSSKDM